MGHFLRSTIIQYYSVREAILSAENSGKPLGGRGSVPNPAGGAHSAPPAPLAGADGAYCPLPKNRTPAFGFNFRSFGSHSAVSSNSLHSPQCLGVSIKTVAVYFRSQRMHQNVGFFYLKYFKKFLGSPRGGRGDIFSHPPTRVPTRQMPGPLRF